MNVILLYPYIVYCEYRFNALPIDFINNTFNLFFQGIL